MRLLRERRGLSLRELGTLADTDHAYIAKIERGEKEAPPEETFARLARSLRTSAHEISLLRFLGATPNIAPDLAVHAVGDLEVTPELLTIAASTVHRGAGRPSPAELIVRAKRAKRIMEGNE